MTQIEVKMSAIYEAAHEVLPEKAERFVRQAETITGAIEPIVAEMKLAGNPPLGDDLGAIAIGLFSHMNALVTTFNDTALALDTMADRFVSNDEGDAAAWLAQNRQFEGEPELPPTPTAPDL